MPGDRRIVERLARLGDPLSPADAELLRAGPADAERERVLDRYTLLRLDIDRHGIGRAALGGAKPVLRELGWRAFLLRVANPTGRTGPVTLIGRSVIPEGDLQPGIHDDLVFGNDVGAVNADVPYVAWTYDAGFGVGQWLGYRCEPLTGAPVEHLVLELYSQRGGSNPAVLAAAAGAPRWRDSHSVGVRVEFDALPAGTVTLDLRDADGAGTTASLTIRDGAGRGYPAPAHRLEPDLGYQEQIYRADRETIRLAAGDYRVEVSRGPEYRVSTHRLAVRAGEEVTLPIRLERWIDPAAHGWYSGDPHLHPEGQRFGVVSKLGLRPDTMLRQVRGEGLAVGGVLIWTGGYYYEKQFLTGHVHEPTYELPFPATQAANNVTWTPKPTPHDADSVIRYDVEQCAGPTNLAGHLALLGLTHHDWPDGGGVYGWPSWNLPVLAWARAQGAVAGYVHVGHGMDVESRDLPNYEIPPMDGIGANDCLISVPHGVVDFLAGTEMPHVCDLNLWYHLLNCGFAIPMIGETDFFWVRPRVGCGRTYVELADAPAGDAGYRAWLAGVRAGRVYFGDGRSHLHDFTVNGHPLGAGPLDLAGPGRVTVSVRVAAWLDETPIDPDAGQFGYPWHLERARLGTSRDVPLEVVVDARVVHRREFRADGQPRTLTFEIDIADSAWVAVRILPSAHTAPIVVTVGGRPVRASRRSARWCADTVDRFWEIHRHRIRESERPAADAARTHAP